MAAEAIIAAEIIAAVVTSIAEYLKAAGVKEAEVDKMLDETFARIRKKDPTKLPPV